jgi:hypothetical protein
MSANPLVSDGGVYVSSAVDLYDGNGGGRVVSLSVSGAGVWFEVRVQ